MEDDGKKVVDILLYEIRQVRGKVEELSQTVTTLKVKFGLVSAFFGAVGGIIFKVVTLFLEYKR